MATKTLAIVTTTVDADTAPTPNTPVLRDGQGGIAANLATLTGVKTGTFQGTVAAQTANFTAGAATDYPVDCTAAAVAVTLPLASANVGTTYNFIKIDSSAHALSISGASGVVTTSTQWGRLRVFSDGTTWYSTN